MKELEKQLLKLFREFVAIKPQAHILLAELLSLLDQHGYEIKKK